MRRVVFVFLLLTVISCGDGLRKVSLTSENGDVTQIYYIDQDSLKQGVQITYFDDSKDVFEKAEYMDDRLHGERTLFYSSGTPEIVESYLHDRLVDTLYVFYKSGRIKMKSFYDNGVHRGLNTLYYENRGVKEEVWFENNVEQGLFKEFHENGELKWVGHYLNGDNEIGELREYDSSGVLIKKMFCDSQSVCNTLWTIEKGDIVPNYGRTSKK